MMINAAATGTPRGVVRVSQPVNVIGIRFANFIKASGYMRRANRPDK